MFCSRYYISQEFLIAKIYYSTTGLRSTASQYFTMPLVGENIHRLLTNSAQFFSKTEELMLASIPETAVDDQECVKQFMGRMLELMEAFDFLCSVMIRTTI